MRTDSIFPLVDYETIREYKLLNDWVWYYYSKLLFVLLIIYIKVLLGQFLYLC